jgi:hypothetical protein
MYKLEIFLSHQGRRDLNRTHKADIYIRDDEKESLSSLLNYHHTKLTDKIHALRAINTLMHNMLEDYLDLEKVKFFQKANSALNDDERWEYNFGTNFEISAPTGQFKFKHPKVHKVFGEETRMYNYRENIKRASKEMILVYLVIVFEEFLSNSLSALFMKRRETLKESGKSILYKDALEYRSIFELIKTMSKEAAKDIIESSIEDLGKRLETKFHLYLNKRDDWPKFKEFFYRRHIVVHNYGYPDPAYIGKTNYKGEKDYWVEISYTYINEAFSVFENYANEITQSFHQKYVHQKIGRKKK